MATTKTELLNNGVVVATKTAAPFYSWDWTPSTSGASSLTYKRYEDNVLVFTSAAITGTVAAPAGAFEPSSISLQTMWHKGDLATTDATVIDDPITTSTDSLSATPYNITGSSLASSINSKECFDFTGSSFYLTALVPTSFYQGGFSLFAQVSARDGQYYTNQTISYTENTAGTSKFLFFISTTGYLTLYLESNDIGKTVASTDGQFPNGDTVVFDNIDLTLTPLGLVEIYKNNVKLTLTGADTGLDMSLFSNVGYTAFGARKATSGNLFDYKLDGYIRNIIMQPVIHTNQNRTDLATL